MGFQRYFLIRYQQDRSPPNCPPIVERSAGESGHLYHCASALPQGVKAKTPHINLVHTSLTVFSIPRLPGTTRRTPATPRAGACSAAASNLIGARYGRAQRKHFHQIERARETVCLLCALRGGVGERGCMHQGAVGSPTIAAAVFCYTLGAGFGAELGFACSVGLVVLLFLARELTAGKVDAGACQ